MVVDLAGPTPKFVTSGGGDYGGIIEALVGLMDDKMIQVPVGAVKALGVVAKGMGAGFKPHAKSTGVTLLSKVSGSMVYCYDYLDYLLLRSTPSVSCSCVCRRSRYT